MTGREGGVGSRLPTMDGQWVRLIMRAYEQQFAGAANGLGRRRGIVRLGRVDGVAPSNKRAKHSPRPQAKNRREPRARHVARLVRTRTAGPYLFLDLPSRPTLIL